MKEPKKLTTRNGAPVVDNQNTMTAGTARPGAAAGRLVSGETRPLRPGGDPGAPHARQGFRRLRHLHGYPRHHPLHQGQDLLPNRQEDRLVPALLHRGRRARRRRRRARHPRLRNEVLYRGRELGPGGQQHAGLLPPRSAQVPRPQPRGQAGSPHQPAQRQEQLGLLDLAARGAAPGHHRHERPGHPALLPPHARLRQPHLQLHQRQERAVLGQVPPADPAGHQKPDRRRGRGDHRQGPGKPPARPLREHRKRGLPSLDDSHSRSCRRRMRPPAPTTPST